MAKIERLNPEGVHAPVGGYSHLCRAEARELLFLAGQVAVDIEGNFVGGGDIKAQVPQIYENIERILQSAGASWSNVVQLTTYIVGRETVDPYLAVRSQIVNRFYPDGDLPPSTLLLIDGLYTEEALAEVTAVAAIP